MCVFRLIEDGHVVITAVVHVDDIFAVGRMDICDHLCIDLLYGMIPVGELKWYGGCFNSRDCDDRGTPTISEQRFAEELVRSFVLTQFKTCPLKPVSSWRTSSMM